MIRKLRAQRNRLHDSESGIGLVEVLVALMIFTIVALGMSYSLMTIQRVTADTKNREVATSLAGGEIDRILAAGNPFALESGRTSKTVSGVTYNIDRSVDWITDADADGSTCGTDGGNLLYKTVNLSVTWNGMLLLRNAVRADTVLAPVDRINQPSYGTVLFSTYGADGTGRKGVSITLTPIAGGGGAAITTAIPATNNDGCSWALKVQPGTYRATMTKTNFLSTAQVAIPIYDPLTVTAGQSTSFAVEYDERVRLALNYRTNAPAARMPSAIDVSILGAAKTIVETSAVTSKDLYPVRAGYTAATGRYSAPTETDPIGCTNIDPKSWGAGAVGAVNKTAGAPSQATVSDPGTTGKIDVAMGAVTVNVPLGVTKLTAKTAAPASVNYPGDPGCSKPMTYTFTGLTGGSTTTLALPYGSWEFSYLSILPPLLDFKLSAPAVSVPVNQGAVSGTIVTLDPRGNA